MRSFASIRFAVLFPILTLKNGKVMLSQFLLAGTFFLIHIMDLLSKVYYGTFFFYLFLFYPFLSLNFNEVLIFHHPTKKNQLVLSKFVVYSL